MIKEAKFFLDKPNGTVLTHIFLKYTCTDAVLKYSTGYKIIPTDWNPEAQRPIDNKKLNNTLNSLFSIVGSYRDKCNALKKPVLEQELRAELNEQTNNIGSISNGTMYPQLEAVIKGARDGKILTQKNKKRYSPGTLVNWEKTKNKLFEFNPKLQFDHITLDTYNAFIVFCNNKRYSLNYTGSLIKDWKTMMIVAGDQKYHSTNIHNHRQFKVLSEDSIQIYLDEKEIDAIYKLDLSYSVIRETIRDRYVINLYNGLRISDMKGLDLKMFQNGTISDINQKTTKGVVIPIHPIVEDIIAKYGGELPHQYHENVVNRYIKDIARKAGINERTIVRKTIGGEVKQYVMEKWEMVGCHTSRRSLVTNLLKHATTTEVKLVVGMTLKTLEKYNKRSSKENAETLKDNVFYKRKG